MSVTKQEDDNTLIIKYCEENKTEELLQLIQNNKNENSNEYPIVNIISEFYEWRPLHYGCWKGHIDIVNILLQHGAIIEAKNKNNRTPLYTACQFGHIDIVNILLQHGAIIEVKDKDDCTPLYIACQKGHIDVVNILLEHNADINSLNKNDHTPLYVACYDGYIDIVNILLQHGAIIEVKAKDDCTPLYIACQKGHIDIVNILLEHNADINSLNKNDCTPLYVACYHGYIDIVNILLQNNANINIENKYGKKPIDVVCSFTQISDENKNNKQKIIDLLNQYNSNLPKRKEINNNNNLLYNNGDNDEENITNILNEQIKLLNGKNQILNEKNNQKDEEIQILRKENNEKNNKINELNDTINKMKENENKLIEENNMLNQEVENLKSNNNNNNNQLIFNLDHPNLDIKDKAFFQLYQMVSDIHNNTNTESSSNSKLETESESESESESEEYKKEFTPDWIIKEEQIELNEDDNTSFLGGGNFSNVYKGEYLDTIVAIKILNDRHLTKEDKIALLQEAYLLSKLHYTYILGFNGVCPRSDGSFVLITEYMSNGTLTSYLKNTDINISYEEKLKIIYDIVRGLNYLHQHHILHRDLKSMNILLDDQYKAKISDFGLSRSKSSISSKSLEKSSAGTVRWKPPESFTRKEKNGLYSDIYSLGVLIWEVLTRNTKPYSDEDDDSSIMGYILHSEYVDIPDDINDDMKTLLLNCWKRNVNERLTSDEVVKQIKIMIKNN